jgi:carbamoyl-phosphate synthase small subunit
MNLNPAYVLLADGTIFYGKSIGISGTTFGEICFNTGMTGYQEIFTDPSYKGQIITMANVHLGNYGVHPDEWESDSVKVSGVICRNFSYSQSRYGEVDSLKNYFEVEHIICISNVDTRALVSYIREHGAQNAAICTDDTPIEETYKQLLAYPSMEGMALGIEVSTKEAYTIGNRNSHLRIAALDLGIKQNILRNFVNRDCFVKVFPHNSSIEEMLSFEPDGFFISNGPGDPEPLVSAQELVRQIVAKNYPLFGICLGHQVIALAHGIPTYKMFNGHRGINHPIKNLITGKGEITSQNHGFAVNKEALLANTEFELTHLHLNDATVAGMRMVSKPCFSVQYHPEASPGPHDSSYLFEDFISLMKEFSPKVGC